MMNRRHLKAIVLALVVLMLLIGCGSKQQPTAGSQSQPSQAQEQNSAEQAAATESKPAPKELGTVRIGGQARTYEYVYAGHDWGKKFGIKSEMEFLSSAAEPAQMLTGGQVDIGFISPSRLIPMIDKEPNRYISVGVTSWGAQRASIVVPVNSPVQSLAELRGQKVAARIGAGNWGSLLMYVEDQGWKIEDFQVVNMNIEDMGGALSQGLVDGALMWEPYTATVELAGIAKPIMNLKGYGTLSNHIVTTREFAEKNPEKLIAFLASWYEASQGMLNDPATVAVHAANTQEELSGVQVDPRVHELTLERVYVDVTDHMKERQLFIDELVETAEALLKDKKIPAMPNLNAFYDSSYLEKAIELSKSSS